MLSSIGKCNFYREKFWYICDIVCSQALKNQFKIKSTKFGLHIKLKPPPHQNKKNIPRASKQTRKVSLTKTQVYQGAIPSPEMMEGYKNLDSTFPNRILSMAEKEQSHSHKMDGKIHIAVLIQTSVAGC